MRIRLRGIVLMVAAVAAATFCMSAVSMSAGQAPAAGAQPYRAPRATDGHPDLNGIWQAFVTADWDIEAHPSNAGPHPEIMGVYGAQPGGLSIVEGGALPYKPEALAKRRPTLTNA